jgi:hypothetical protein
VQNGDSVLESDVEIGGPRLPYWSEALLIARLSDHAITRIASDRVALLIGACVLGAGAAMSFAVQRILAAPAPGAATATGALPLFVMAPIVGVLQILISAVNIGLMHGVGKIVFGATGRYLGLLRVLWLGSWVLWLGVIPVVGSIVGGIWFLLISLVTFEQVDGVERIQALFLLVGLSALTFMFGALIS